MHDFLNQITSFLVVHRPDLLDTLVISYFKFFKALLELDKFSSEKLIILGVFSIQVLCLRLCLLELDFFVSEFLAIGPELKHETLSLSFKDLLTLAEDLIIEFKLLMIELIDSFHVFHTFLKNLHLRLELDLLFILLISILAHDLF